MGLRDRTKKLERRTGLDRPKPCPECGGRILHKVRNVDGTVSYPLGEPCSECGNALLKGGGGVVVIEVVMPEEVEHGN
jgi:hypothetical protein